MGTSLESALSHRCLLGDLRPVRVSQPNLLHRIAVKIKWRKGEWSKLHWVSVGKKDRVLVKKINLSPGVILNNSTEGKLSKRNLFSGPLQNASHNTSWTNIFGLSGRHIWMLLASETNNCTFSLWAWLCDHSCDLSPWSLSGNHSGQLHTIDLVIPSDLGYSWSQCDIIVLPYWICGAVSDNTTLHDFESENDIFAVTKQASLLNNACKSLLSPKLYYSCIPYPMSNATFESA